MNNERITGLIGLALRSRQAVLGAEACRIMIRSGNCGVMLIDASAGTNTRKKTEEQCERAGIPLKTVPPGSIEQITGRSNMLIAIREGSFSETIIREIAKETQSEQVID